MTAEEIKKIIDLTKALHRDGIEWQLKTKVITETDYRKLMKRILIRTRHILEICGVDVEKENLFINMD